MKDDPSGQSLANAEERIDLLETEVELLRQIIQDPKHSNFNLVIIERKLTRADVNKIYGFKDMLSENPTATDREDFSGRLGDLIPKHKGDSTLAGAILTALNKDGKYTNVYEYFKFNDSSLQIE